MSSNRRYTNHRSSITSNYSHATLLFHVTTIYQSLNYKILAKFTKIWLWSWSKRSKIFDHAIAKISTYAWSWWVPLYRWCCTIFSSSKRCLSLLIYRSSLLPLHHCLTWIQCCIKRYHVITLLHSQCTLFQVISTTLSINFTDYWNVTSGTDIECGFQVPAKWYWSDFIGVVLTLKERITELVYFKFVVPCVTKSDWIWYKGADVLQNSPQLTAV